MARVNEIFSGRYNRFMQKLFSMKGGPPAPQLASEVQMVHPLFHGVENRGLEGWDRFGILGSATGGAGQNAAVRFRNPAGSGMVAVVEKLTVFITVADNNFLLEQGAAAADLSNLIALNITRWDARGRSGPTAILSQQPAALGLLQNVKHQAALGVQVMYDYISSHDQEMPVLPGDAIQLRTVSLNLTLISSWWWRERAIEDSEKFL